jgi:glyoxylase-like metal-dependent hydrolase (beta-lactamase superfamily II)
MTPEERLDYPVRDVPAPGTTREIAPGVHWLRMPLPFALDHINLWLLEDGDGCVVVDCGYASDETRAHWETIFSTVLAGRPVRRVLATHCHPDHVGNAAWLCERFGATLWMSQAEYLTAHAWRDDAAGFTNAGLVAFFRANGLDPQALGGMQERGNSYKRGVPDLPHAYRRIMEGDAVPIGGRAWRAIAGYGHAPEHISLYCADTNVLISGDMLLPRISTNVAVASVTPEADPLALFLASIARYAAELPADVLVLPSHGLPFRGAHERVAQLEEHHRARLAELEEACAAPRAAADVIGTLFRRKLDLHQTFFAMGETLAHLNYLAARGRLTRTVGADGTARFMRRPA